MAIRILDKQTVNKIAAGEVVERPVSVVKELVENAIDAKASNIAIEIKNGGISYIRVTDNGCGIDKAEIKLAFMPHATSKLPSDDMFNIRTLGFRGEALSSIASVSHVEMVTKTEEQDSGTMIELSGGDIKNISDIGCANGTSVIVRNLFFNTPARLKFLKKSNTEASHIEDLITRLALSNPFISFKYIADESVRVQTVGDGNVRRVALNIYGNDIARGLLPLNYSSSCLELNGFLGKPEISRTNKSFQNLFINGRYVKSDIVSNAVSEAFRTHFQFLKHPVYIVYLSIPVAELDVNVHPSKLEVRFSKENEVYETISRVCRGTLQNANHTERPFLSNIMPPKPTTEQPQTEPVRYVGNAIFNDLSFNEYAGREISFTEMSDFVQEKVPQKEKKYKPNKPEVVHEQVVVEAEPTPVAPLQNGKIIGQVFDTYWLIEVAGKMYIADQHAAHERVRFDEILESLTSKTSYSEQLIEPYKLELTALEKTALTDNLSLFEAMGFVFNQDKKISITAVPYVLKSTGLDYFTSILDKLTAGNFDKLKDELYAEVAMYACKSAVKANQRISPFEARQIMQKLCRVQNPFTCPHGRPTIVELSKSDFEKMFAR